MNMKFLASCFCVAALFASASACEEVLAKSVFEAQIVVNTLVVQHSTPAASLDLEWVKDTGWVGDDSASSFLLLVRIDDALVRAAADYYVETHGLDAPAAEKIKEDLTRRYGIADGEVFFIFAAPLSASDCPEYFRYELVDLQYSANLRTFEGSLIAQERTDSCPPAVLQFRSPVFSCLLTFPKQSNNESPYFYVSVPIQYFIRHHPTDAWIASKSFTIADFRVELGEVPLAAMLDSGIAWETLNEVHVISQLEKVRATQGFSAASLLTDIAVKVVAGVIVKAIKI
jgi:hypothetical protein